MLSTNRLRSIYSKIQTQLFYMIPEKWDKIYLYASVMEQANNLETGEMFFYYFPTGILKKNPVNVYEIPSKFNIDEEEYLKLVDRLYSTIEELRKAFKESSEERVWTNLTITISNAKFNVEYSYDNLMRSQYSSYDRHIIWKCKYLNFPLDRLTKKDRKMVEEYYREHYNHSNKTKTYSEGMYKQKVHNIIEYNTTGEHFIRQKQNSQKPNEEEVINEKYGIKKKDNIAVHTNKKESIKNKINKEDRDKTKEEKTMKNQILKF